MTSQRQKDIAKILNNSIETKREYQHLGGMPSEEEWVSHTAKLIDNFLTYGDIDPSNIE